jgi:hypothetical protein
MAVVNAFLSIAAAMRIAHFALAGKSVLCLDGKGLPVQFAGEPRLRVSVTSHDHNGEVGTMRWKITLDQDDLMLAVATVISALAISLALI